jgi:hypothetical protein
MEFLAELLAGPFAEMFSDPAEVVLLACSVAAILFALVFTHA